MSLKRLSKGEKVLVVAIHVILFFIGMSMIYPFIYVLAASLSSGNALSRGEVILLPVEMTISAYKVVFGNTGFWYSMFNSLFYMIVGTLFSMVISTLGAYALSKQRLLFKWVFNIFLAITIWFTAGMIPAYLNYKDLGLFGTRLGIIVGFGVSAVNIILLRNYFEGISKDYEESAYMDGANDWQVFSRIYLPLAKPAVATVSLFYALARWNSWFWPSIFFHDDNNMTRLPLQSFIRILISQEAAQDPTAILDPGIVNSTLHSPETLTMAVMVCAIVPMVIIYPFALKYFTKGITLGGVKE